MIINLETLKELVPYIISILTFIIGLYKDKVLDALSIKKIEKEVDHTTSDVIEKNLGLYQRILDDYAARKEAEDIKQRQRVDDLELRIDIMAAREVILIKAKEDKELEVSKLREDILEIKYMLDKALKQLDYYKRNSDLELPSELQ